jgi:acyl-CoA thioester hydrolase
MTPEDSCRMNIAAYPVVRELSTRVSDMDGYGHLNAIRIGHFYEDARAAFYGVAFTGLTRARTLVAQLTIRYLGEGHWPGIVEIGTCILKVGNSSYTMGQGLFQDDRCLGLCETVLVSTENGRSTPLPDDIRVGAERMHLRVVGSTGSR